MKLSRTFLASALVAAIAVLGVVGVRASRNGADSRALLASPFSDGDPLAGLPRLDDTPGELAALVNGQPITRWQLETAIEGARKTGRTIDRDDALGALIDQELLRQEANRRGFTASDAEALKQLAEMRDAMSAEERDLLLRANVELGAYTGPAEGYWTDPKVVRATAEGIGKGRLLAELKANAASGEDYERSRAGLIATLRSEANIELGP